MTSLTTYLTAGLFALTPMITSAQETDTTDPIVLPGLLGALQGTENTYTATADDTIYYWSDGEGYVGSIGTMKPTELTADFTGFSVIGSPMSDTEGMPTYLSGIAIGNAQTLTVKNATSWQGFDTAFMTQTGGTLNLDNITMSGNAATTANTDTTANGGAIHNAGTTTLNNAILQHNTATAGEGVTGSGNGGAIWNSGTLTANNTSFTGNVTTVAADTENTGRGGAIYNDTTGTLTLNKTVFNNNSAGSEGGALYNAGTATLTDSTFTDNTATTGGAIWNSGTLTLSGTNTFSGNTALLGTANDIHNDGTLTISGTTTLNGGLTGTGTTTVTDGSILNIGTTTVQNNQISFAANAKLALSIDNLNTYGRLNATTEAGDGTLSFDQLSADSLQISIARGTIDQGQTAQFDIFSADTITLGDDQTLADILGEKWRVGRKYFAWFDDTNLLNIEAIKLACTAGNNCAVADAWLDELNQPTTTTGQAVLNQLDALGITAPDSNAFNTALSALAPTTAPVLTSQAVNITRQLDHMIDARMRHTSSFFKTRAKAYHDKVPTRGTALWADAAYDKTDYSGSTAFDGNNKTIAVGLDSRPRLGFRFGIGYAYTQSDISTDYRDFDADTHTAMLYMDYQPDNLFWRLLLTYGLTQYDESRRVADIPVTDSFDTQTIAAHSTWGYNLGHLRFGERGQSFSGDFIPTFGLRYYHITQDDYTDTAGQKIEGETYQILTASAGLKYDIEYPVLKMSSLRFEAGIAALYDILQDDIETTAVLGDNLRYTVTGDNIERLGGEATLRLGLSIDQRLDIGLSYSGLFKSDYSNHTGSFNIRYLF